jgi:hypothetical protein
LKHIKGIERFEKEQRQPALDWDINSIISIHQSSGTTEKEKRELMQRNKKVKDVGDLLKQEPHLTGQLFWCVCCSSNFRDPPDASCKIGNSSLLVDGHTRHVHVQSHEFCEARRFNVPYVA